ncbi:hypothetical protein CGRA01v4_01283 [Colletotrichum graminicola]|nr:hypothetical protein CGRA01v4_01283 [Colletotrichum graminicola]
MVAISSGPHRIHTRPDPRPKTILHEHTRKEQEPPQTTQNVWQNDERGRRPHPERPGTGRQGHVVRWLRCQGPERRGPQRQRQRQCRRRSPAAGRSAAAGRKEVRGRCSGTERRNVVGGFISRMLNALRGAALLSCHSFIAA